MVNYIQCGDTINGFFGDYSNDAPHFYKLVLSSTYNVRFSDCGTNFDSTLFVYDSSGSSMMDSTWTECDGDDCLSGHCTSGCYACEPVQSARENFDINSLPPGTYYVGIGAYSSLTGGGEFYTLSITCDLVTTDNPTTDNPTISPTTKAPTSAPSRNPSNNPTIDPSNNPTIAPTPSPTLSTSMPCGNNICYYVDIHPLIGSATSKTIAIASKVENVLMYYKIFITSIGNHCVDPRITAEYEEIDFSQSNENFGIFDQNGILIKRCAAGGDNNCGTWLNCLSFRSLGIEKIEKDNNYTITIEQTSNVNSLCSIHDYSLHVQLTIICSDQSVSPSNTPSTDPSPSPTDIPTSVPTDNPTYSPTNAPTDIPTPAPTNNPTVNPTKDPTMDPTMDPTIDPTGDPTIDPSIDPTMDPTNDPTEDPTTDPTSDPITRSPTMEPTIHPTNSPTLTPSKAPTYTKIIAPGNPTPSPSNQPSSNQSPSMSYRQLSVSQ